MNEQTRANIKSAGVSIWLKAELPILMRRVMRRDNRPLLKTTDPEARMRELMALRYPTYALADLTIESREVPHEEVVAYIISGLLNGPLAPSGVPPTSAAPAFVRNLAQSVVERASRARGARQPRLRCVDRAWTAAARRRSRATAAWGSPGRDRDRPQCRRPPPGHTGRAVQGRRSLARRDRPRAWRGDQELRATGGLERTACSNWASSAAIWWWRWAAA